MNIQSDNTLPAARPRKMNPFSKCNKLTKSPMISWASKNMLPLIPSIAAGATAGSVAGIPGIVIGATVGVLSEAIPEKKSLLEHEEAIKSHFDTLSKQAEAESISPAFIIYNLEKSKNELEELLSKQGKVRHKFYNWKKNVKHSFTSKDDKKNILAQSANGVAIGTLFVPILPVAPIVGGIVGVSGATLQSYKNDKKQEMQELDIRARRLVKEILYLEGQYNRKDKTECVKGKIAETYNAGKDQWEDMGQRERGALLRENPSLQMSASPNIALAKDSVKIQKQCENLKAQYNKLYNRLAKEILLLENEYYPKDKTKSVQDETSNAGKEQWESIDLGARAQRLQDYLVGQCSVSSNIDVKSVSAQIDTIKLQCHKLSEITLDTETEEKLGKINNYVDENTVLNSSRLSSNSNKNDSASSGDAIGAGAAAGTNALVGGAFFATTVAMSATAIDLHKTRKKDVKKSTQKNANREIIGNEIDVLCKTAKNMNVEEDVLLDVLEKLYKDMKNDLSPAQKKEIKAKELKHIFQENKEEDDLSNANGLGADLATILSSAGLMVSKYVPDAAIIGAAVGSSLSSAIYVGKKLIKGSDNNRRADIEHKLTRLSMFLNDSSEKPIDKIIRDEGLSGIRDALIDKKKDQGGLKKKAIKKAYKLYQMDNKKAHIQGKIKDMYEKHPELLFKPVEQ